MSLYERVSDRRIQALCAVAAVLAVGAGSLWAQADDKSRDDVAKLARKLGAAATQGNAKSLDGFLDLARRGLRGPTSEVRLNALEVVGPILWDNQYLVTEDGGATDYKRKYGAELVPEVLRLLNDTDPAVRVKALWALGGYYRTTKSRADSDVRDKIASHLKDSDENVRLEAITALAWAGATERAGEIAAFMEDEEPRVRLQAIWALGVLQAKDQVEKVAAHMTDPHPQVRGWALSVTDGLGGENRVDEFAKFLEDEAPNVRAVAINHVARRADSKSYFDRIAARLQDADPLVRLTAIRVLARQWKFPKDYVHEFARLLDDKDPGVRREAELAMERLSDLGGWDIWCAESALRGARIPLPLKRFIAGLKGRLEPAAESSAAGGSQPGAGPKIRGVQGALQGVNKTVAPSK